tara:strand:- start:1283 stop:1579 length:297 start_codon:yes stop_codon:yes gene_type:complete
MNEFKGIPSELSYKQLSQLLTKAHKDILVENINSDHDTKLEELMGQWTRISQEVISILGSKKNYLVEGKSPKSLMALGAMEVHLNMAIQALKASEKEE